jgi:hypothetical protein
MSSCPIFVFKKNKTVRVIIIKIYDKDKFSPANASIQAVPKVPPFLRGASSRSVMEY